MKNRYKKIFRTNLVAKYLNKINRENNHVKNSRKYASTLKNYFYKIASLTLMSFNLRNQGVKMIKEIFYILQLNKPNVYTEYF